LKMTLKFGKSWLLRKKKTPTEVEVHILDVQVYPLGSRIRFRLPSGEELTTIAFLDQTVKNAIRRKLEMIEDSKRWMGDESKKHKKYKGKTLKIKL